MWDGGCGARGGSGGDGKNETGRVHELRRCSLFELLRATTRTPPHRLVLVLMIKHALKLRTGYFQTLLEGNRLLKRDFAKMKSGFAHSYNQLMEEKKSLEAKVSELTEAKTKAQVAGTELANLKAEMAKMKEEHGAALAKQKENFEAEIAKMEKEHETELEKSAAQARFLKEMEAQEKRCLKFLKAMDNHLSELLAVACPEYGRCT